MRVQGTPPWAAALAHRDDASPARHSWQDWHGMNTYDVQRDFATFVDLLRLQSQQRRDQLVMQFVHDGDESVENLTYGQLDLDARVIAARLSEVTTPGDRVLLLFPPGLDFVRAFFGCLYAGAIAVPAYPPRAQRGLERVRTIIADAAPALALTSDDILQSLDGRSGGEPLLENIPLVSTHGVPRSAGPSWQRPAIDRHTIACLQYTSGSTSTPRGVQLTHSCLIHNSALIQSGFQHWKNDHGVIWLPPYHDMGLIGGLLQPIYLGCAVTVLPPVSVIQKPLRWLQWITRTRATTSGGPDFAYDLCVRKIPDEALATLDLSSWRVAFAGAEPVHYDTLDAFARKFSVCGFRREAFYPCYGLAEATLMVTGGEVAEAPSVRWFDARALEQRRVCEQPPGAPGARALVGNGLAVANTELRIVHPETRVPCAAGEIGEVWVSGPSIAAGYWNNPEATERVFRARLACDDGRNYLRTGDFGFVLGEDLFLAGRIKEVMIVRGRNIYPQDIQRTLERAHPAVRPHATATFLLETDAIPRLIVLVEIERQYVRDSNPQDHQQLLAQLQSALAVEHDLVADEIVLMKPGGIPTTSSGKIQNNESRELYRSGALKGAFATSRAESDVLQPHERARRAAENTRPPRNAPNEQTIRSASGTERRTLLRQLIHFELHRIVGRDIPVLAESDPLAAAGADSLAAVELVSRMEAHLGIQLSLQAAFNADNLGKLLDLILATVEQQPSMPHTGTVPSHRPADAYALSYGQQALWYLYRLAPTSPAYNLPFAVTIEGPLDVDVLRRSLEWIAARHDSLRATFVSERGRPWCLTSRSVEVAASVVAAEHYNEEELRERVTRDAHLPYDLEDGPLLRLHLYRQQPTRHIVLLVMHHIAFDFWSFQILLDELRTAYTSLLAGQTPSLPMPSRQYADYVEFQRTLLASDEGQRQWQYWQEQLGGELPVLDLPTDSARGASQTFAGAEWHVHLPAHRQRQLEAFAERNGTTSFAVVLAAYALLLRHLSGQNELVIGAPFSGRTRSEFSRTIGYFVNPLPLRVRLRIDQSLGEFVQDVAETVRLAQQNQDLPTSLLVERLQPQRDASQSTLFQTLFVWNRPHQLDTSNAMLKWQGSQLHLPLGTLETVAWPIETQAAMFDVAVTVLQAGGQLRLTWHYNTDLFREGTIERWTTLFEYALAEICEHPEQTCGRVSLVPPEQREKVLALGRTESLPEAPTTLVELFERQARRTPEAIALVDGEKRISYAELNGRATQWAHFFRRLTVHDEPLIGLCMPRSAEQLIALVGILRSGAAYLPLDPDLPAERMRLVLEGARPAAVLTNAAFRSRFPAGRCDLYTWESEIAGVEQLAGQPATALRSAAPAPRDLAALIYTSGSTGVPNGVELEHGALAQYLRHAARYFECGPADRVLQFASLSFDAALEEIFIAWGIGATLCLRDEAMLDSPRAFLARVADWQLTVLDLPTAFWRTLMQYLVREHARLPDCVRLVILGGESAPAEYLSLWAQHAPAHCRLVNTYGPTETSIVATMWEVPRYGFAGDAVPIGRPVPGLEAYVLDEQQQVVGVGVRGELYLGGSGLARGYRDRPDLTADRFVSHPWSRNPHARLYRTGDLVRWNDRGELVYLGRRDHQLKIRGFRVELGEVENALRQYPAVSEAVVVAVQQSGAAQLRAFIAWNAHEAGTVEDLRDYARRTLPEYMVPAQWTVLAALPHTASGKVDRKRLERLPARVEAAREARTAPRSETERQVAELWQEVLRVAERDIDDDFFEAGGHSLLAMQLLAEIERTFEVTLSARQLLEQRTIRNLAALLEQGRHDGTRLPVVHLRDGDRMQPALWMAHATDGTVLCYAALAQQYDGPLAWNGLQARGVEREGEPLVSIPAMANYYAQAIRRVQPSGPWMVGGWSLGGIVAFELARQLDPAGSAGSHLVLIDSPPPVLAGQQPSPTLDPSLALDTLRAYSNWLNFSFELPDDQLLSLLEAESWPEVRGMLARHIAPAEIVDSLEPLWSVAHRNLRATDQYRADPWGGRMTLLLAKDHPGRSASEFVENWQRLALAGLDVIHVPGTHTSLFLDPEHRAHLARALAELL